MYVWIYSILGIKCVLNSIISLCVALYCSKRNFNVKSFGTGINVKLPGVSADRPNIYDFGITYDEMYRDLKTKDPQLYLFTW